MSRMPSQARDLRQGRNIVSLFSGGLVSKHLGEHDVRQATLQGPHRHHRRGTDRFPRVIEDPALGGVTQLHDGHEVQGPVNPPVSRTREAMAFLVTEDASSGAVPSQEANRSLSRKR